MVIRAARPDDLAVLPEIERRAGAGFRALGMAAVADDPQPAAAELDRYRRAGQAWVAIVGDQVVGYLLVEELADSGHIEQVTVDPTYARQGIGARLIDLAATWTRTQVRPALTLTCYERVPWNAPYYARLGFAVVPDGEQPDELRAIRRQESERGLDAWPRVVMARWI